MTEAMFQRVLDRAEAQTQKRGPAKLPEEKALTLYVASYGAAMTVTNIVELSLVEGVVEAKNKKGEIYLLSLETLIAASISAGDDKGGMRRAGFIG